MKKLVTICLFAKPPRPGEVKTRLAESIGERAAVTLASAFLADTWRAISALEWAEPVLAVTAYEGLPPLPGRPTVPSGLTDRRREAVLRGDACLGMLAAWKDSSLGPPGRALSLRISSSRNAS